jgi:hypothetical protein
MIDGRSEEHEGYKNTRSKIKNHKIACRGRTWCCKMEGGKDLLTEKLHLMSKKTSLITHSRKQMHSNSIETRQVIKWH